MPEKLATEKVLMTERPTSPDDNTVLKTSAGEANVEVITMTWYSQVLIRCLRVYLQSLVGFMAAVGTGAAAGVGVSLDAQGFLNLLVTSASLAIAPAALSFLQNAIEILAKLDSTAPQIRA